MVKLLLDRGAKIDAKTRVSFRVNAASDCGILASDLFTAVLLKSLVCLAGCQGSAAFLFDKMVAVGFEQFTSLEAACGTWCMCL